MGFEVNCIECDGELEMDGDNDTEIIEHDVCVHNYKCVECEIFFEIEYHAVDIRYIGITS